MFKNKRLLYFVNDSKEPLFKIGIATDHKRFRQLQIDYCVDLTDSIYFEGEDKHIQNMERSLHALFHEYRLENRDGTGGTEWFKKECWDAVYESLCSNIKISKFKINPRSRPVEGYNKPPDIDNFQFTECEQWKIENDAHVRGENEIHCILYDFHNKSVEERNVIRELLVDDRRFYDNSEFLAEAVEKYGSLGCETETGNAILTKEQFWISAHIYAVGLEDNTETDTHAEFVLKNIFTYKGHKHTFEYNSVIFTEKELDLMKIDLQILKDIGYGYFICKKHRIPNETSNQYCIYDINRCYEKMFWRELYEEKKIQEQAIAKQKKIEEEERLKKEEEELIADGYIITKR